VAASANLQHDGRSDVCRPSALPRRNGRRAHLRQQHRMLSDRIAILERLVPRRLDMAAVTSFAWN